MTTPDDPIDTGKPSGEQSEKDPRFQWTQEEAERPERAFIIIPEFAKRNDSDIEEASQRAPSSRLEEAIGLAEAISLDVVGSAIAPIRKVKPATLLGTGKIAELAAECARLEVGLVIFDHSLSPVQQQKLEEELNAKVLDRTALILEIFGERAQTKEGTLQVELAHLNYQKGRLVRSWTHLERQRGGLGFVGGPGETQIEADRRQIQERINRLERELEKVKGTRTLHRKKRKKVPHPIVALVGYTNAGKSTLFNRLTGADVFAKDLLFATLDPTLRRLTLPEGTLVILSDTVGFVSNLPTHLVAAFRATLEEVIEADLVLHVRDISDPETKAQANDVYSILKQLGFDAEDQQRIIEVWNKTDLLNTDALEAIRQTRKSQENAYMISAKTGEGVPELLAAVENFIAGKDAILEIVIDVNSLSRLPWVYENTHVLEREDREDGSVALKVRAPEKIRAEVAILAA